MEVTTSSFPAISMSLAVTIGGGQGDPLFLLSLSISFSLYFFLDLSLDLSRFVSFSLPLFLLSSSLLSGSAWKSHRVEFSDRRRSDLLPALFLSRIDGKRRNARHDECIIYPPLPFIFRRKTFWSMQHFFTLLLLSFHLGRRDIEGSTSDRYAITVTVFRFIDHVSLPPSLSFSRSALPSFLLLLFSFFV